MKLLTVDPGEDTGYSIWEDGKFIDAGQEKLWPFADAVWAGLTGEMGWEETAHISDKLSHVGLIIVEDFRIYPKEAHAGSLDWDQVRTARLIGALTFMSRVLGIPFKLQGANIKPAALAAGAESYYLTPAHPNRHANDAIQHAVYHYALEKGIKPVRDNATDHLITDNN